MTAQKTLLATPGASLRLAEDGAVRELVAPTPLSPNTPEAMARAALHQYEAAFGHMPALALERVSEESGATHVRFHEVSGGYPVAEHSIDVHLATTASGPELRRIASSLATLPTPTPSAPGSLQSLGMAKIRAQQIAVQPEQNWQPEVTTMIRDFGVGPRLVNRVLLHGDAADLEIDLDAYSNELLGKIDRSENGTLSAMIFPINDSRGGRELLPLEYLRVGDNVTDAAGTFAGDTATLDGLSGPFFRVLNGAGPVLAYSGAGSISLAPNDPHLGELSAFHFLAVSHDFFGATFGFYDLDQALVTATVHYGNCLFNAFATGTTKLVFGDGCGAFDYAQSADYVLHEYTHLVTNSISAVDYSQYNEAGAFSEGQSDYFACTQTDDPQWGENPYGIAARQCDNAYTYQRDYTGEAHNGGMLYAGAMWDLRKQFGRSLADALAFELLYHVPRDTTLLDVRDAAVAADLQHFSGAHHDAIVAAFDRHGINDKPIVFITSNNYGQPASTSTPIIFSAHAQGFERSSVRYHWTFADGSSTADGDEVTHTFSGRPYVADLRVSDAAGHAESVSLSLQGCRQTRPGSMMLWMISLGWVLTRRKRR